MMMTTKMDFIIFPSLTLITSFHNFIFHIFSHIFILYLLYFFSLKIECEKLAQEKTEMQRHYVMVSHKKFRKECFKVEKNNFTFLWLQYYEMSYGLNVEMHKQVREIWKITRTCIELKCEHFPDNFLLTHTFLMYFPPSTTRTIILEFL
jgi:hypothetical protein